MRPGLLPRRYCLALGANGLHRLASMRPGLLPRRYSRLRPNFAPPPPRFNEAGAFAPEILGYDPIVLTLAPGFNEAGAFAPEIFSTVQWLGCASKAELQ